ncbi:hypothetical protein VPFG_00107 [Vibrio phage nt-1]|uniref:Inhibitor of host transcription n=1 Tax=Vibrio phage nt-1 TaxID=115992 RepID=R9TF78_9CAUD|nr:inhibitor of host transcription [Vibrio phage nt-1]AGN30109.1 hypothetical protein VPFG_00107 [Vibrio phage nt-1]
MFIETKYTNMRVQIMNAQTMTNEQIAKLFDMKLSSNGFQAIDKKGRGHFLTDLRQRVMKAEKTKAKATKTRKVREEQEPSVSAEDLLHELQSESSDYWFIRDTQPGMDSLTHGLNVYVSAGKPDHHRLIVRSNQLSMKEIDRELGYLNPRKQEEGHHRAKTTVFFSNKTAKEIVEIVEKLKELS